LVGSDAEVDLPCRPPPVGQVGTNAEKLFTVKKKVRKERFPKETLPAVADLRSSILRRLALCIPLRLKYSLSLGWSDFHGLFK
jgi:hypothetical protein